MLCVMDVEIRASSRPLPYAFVLDYGKLVPQVHHWYSLQKKHTHLCRGYAFVGIH